MRTCRHTPLLVTSLVALAACGGDSPTNPDPNATVFSELKSDFSGSALPSFLSILQKDAGGNIVVGNGVLTLTSPDYTNGGSIVGVYTPSSYALDAAGVYIRSQDPVNQEPYNGAITAFDAAMNGYGISVSSTSLTPGSATLRANRYIAGVVDHFVEIPFNGSLHLWRRFRLSGGVIYMDYAPDNGAGPGTWVNFASENVAAHNPGWNSGASKLYIASGAALQEGAHKVTIWDGLNSNTH